MNGMSMNNAHSSLLNFDLNGSFGGGGGGGGGGGQGGHGNNNPMDVLSQTEQCVVCGDAADGFHYGVRSCRGCNAFFRRAITFDMKFTCRRGGRCPVDKNARCACRACRLNKCFSVGMDKKAVQPKRESAPDMDGEEGLLKPKLESMEPMPATFAPTSTTLELFMPAVAPSPPPNAGLIMRQVIDYADQKRRRRVMLCNSLEEILADDCENALQHVACADDHSAIFQVQMVLMFEWAEKLPHWPRLEAADKTKLLRSFALRYMMLDNVFHTVELGFTDRLVLVNNNYIVPFQYPHFSHNELADERQVKMLMFGPEAKSLVDELVSPMLHLQLSAGEFMAMRMIVFWNPGHIGLTPAGEQVRQEASADGIRELHNYYEHEGTPAVDQRVTTLLLLLPQFTKHIKTLYDTVKLIPSFGKMQEWDSFMDDLLVGF